MKKAILNKRNEIVGIIDVTESKKTIDVCDGYTVKRRIASSDVLYEDQENPVFPAFSQKVYVGAETIYNESKDQPLNLRSFRLSSAKKTLDSMAYKMAEYLTAENGIVDLTQ
jgi:hypothetical protein